jgi:hypothetical protein
VDVPDYRNRGFSKFASAWRCQKFDRQQKRKMNREGKGEETLNGVFHLSQHNAETSGELDASTSIDDVLEDVMGAAARIGVREESGRTVDHIQHRNELIQEPNDLKHLGDDPDAVLSVAGSRIDDARLLADCMQTVALSVGGVDVLLAAIYEEVEVAEPASALAVFTVSCGLSAGFPLRRPHGTSLERPRRRTTWSCWDGYSGRAT